ncbi:lysylphosphatidylglycerol synthase transmembrane domain-containing protein [Acidimicrobium ferrooxidans]|uniref:lysylphosphatidylglycerol synthase transmembrane domain-containing protein n=1 Tax=Acidimicrobium ferrooxidans TaxID=53635 RepID=UPI002478A797|nr:lysylphosphatidylglycerol synthase transmembrane domain-containing protein [Acidimicrobium ferrooxidans]
MRGTRRSLGKLIRHFAIRGLAGFVILLVIEYLVVPEFAGFRKTLSLLDRANYWLVPLAALAEALSLFAYAKLTETVLPRPTPSIGQLAKVDLAGLAVSHVLPGGSASGVGLTARLLSNLGVRGADTGVALATQSVGSALILNALLWLALLVSLPFYGFNEVYLVVAVLGVALMAISIAVVILLTRGNRRTQHAVGTVIDHVPPLAHRRRSIEHAIAQTAERLRALGRDPQLLRRASAWALANWLFDATTLWIMLAAFGQLMNPVALIVAYGIANVAAVLPLTPSGLGVVETLAITLLTGFGAPRGVAILGVLTWRIFNFWLPIPVGVAAYVSLRVQRGEDVTLELDRIDPNLGRPDPDVSDHDPNH